MPDFASQIHIKNGDKCELNTDSGSEQLVAYIDLRHVGGWDPMQSVGVGTCIESGSCSIAGGSSTA